MLKSVKRVVVLAVGLMLGMSGETFAWTWERDWWKSATIADVETLLADGHNVNAQVEGWTPLVLATVWSNTEMVKFLLEKDAWVNGGNDWGWTPLHFASRHGNIEVAKLLLEHSADVNARDDTAETPLFVATSAEPNEGTVEILELLIQHGADVNARGAYGLLPLVGAKRFNHPDVMKLMKEHGARLY